MAHTKLIVGLSVMVAGLPLSAADAAAPPAPPTAKYCLSLEPMTGSHIATVQCRTRDEWAWDDINVDQEWHENGVAVIP